MPTVKELNIQVENRPGTLAKLSNALAGRKVNIIAFQATTAERRSQAKCISSWTIWRRPKRYWTPKD